MAPWDPRSHRTLGSGVEKRYFFSSPKSSFSIES